MSERACTCVCGCDGPGFLLCGWSQAREGVLCFSCPLCECPCSPLQPPALTLALSAGTCDILVPLTYSHLQDCEDLSLSSSVSLSPSLSLLSPLLLSLSISPHSLYLCLSPYLSVSLSISLSLGLSLPLCVCISVSPLPHVDRA